MGGANSQGKTWIERNPGTAAALAAAAAFGLYKIFSSDQSGGTSQNNEADPRYLSYPPDWYNVAADQIEAAVWGTSGIAAWTEDDQAIATILLMMRSDDDIDALINAYGIRTVGTLIKDGGNLVETISEYLDQDMKEEVNEAYQVIGITYRWA